MLVEKDRGDDAQRCTQGMTADRYGVDLTDERMITVKTLALLNERYRMKLKDLRSFQQDRELR